MDLNHQGAGGAGETVVDHCFGQPGKPYSSQNTDHSQRDYELIESDASVSVFHGSTLLLEFTKGLCT
jgi:hypothetical protein